MITKHNQHCHYYLYIQAAVFNELVDSNKLEHE